MDAAALSLHWYNPLVWWAALLCTATTMTNGKKSLHERVTMIARRPRMTAAVVIAVVAIAAVAAGCAFAGAALAAMTEEEALDALDVSLPESVIEEGAIAEHAVSREVDLDGDGTAERIVVDASALASDGAARIWLEDLSGNKLYDLGEIGLSHAGWRALALTEQNSRTYLLDYRPTMFQGEAEYTYALIELRGRAFGAFSARTPAAQACGRPMASATITRRSTRSPPGRFLRCTS